MQSPRRIGTSGKRSGAGTVCSNHIGDGLLGALERGLRGWCGSERSSATRGRAPRLPSMCSADLRSHKATASERRCWSARSSCRHPRIDASRAGGAVGDGNDSNFCTSRKVAIFPVSSMISVAPHGNIATLHELPKLLRESAWHDELGCHGCTVTQPPTGTWPWPGHDFGLDASW